MKTGSLLFQLLFFLILKGNVLAQHTSRDLSVKAEAETNGQIIINSANQKAADTNKVNLMLQAAHIYWHQASARNRSLDTCLRISQNAFKLSRKLGYIYGIDEAAFMMVKAYAEMNQTKAADSTAKLVHGEVRIRSLLAIAEHYTFNFRSDEAGFAKALPYIKEANRIAENTRSVLWRCESLVLLGKHHFKRGDITNGKKLILIAIHSLESIKDYQKAAYYWSALGGQLPENKATFPEIRHALETAVALYLQTGSSRKAAYVLRDLAVLNLNHKKYAEAEMQLTQMQSLFKSVREQLSVTTLFVLGDFYRFRGQYDKGLFYALKAIKTKDIDPKKKLNVYGLMAQIYEALGDYKEALKYCQPVLENSEFKNSAMKHYWCYRLVTIQAVGGDYSGALKFLKNFVRRNSPKFYIQKQLIAAAYGDIYNLAGDERRAEKYYLEMLRLEKYAKKQKAEDLGNKLPYLDKGVNSVLGKFYVKTRRFNNAKYYLRKSLDELQYVDLQGLMETHLMIFKADSALGNYLSAINSFQLHKRLYDSVNSVEKMNQLAALKIKYETEQKINAISLLENKQKLQQAELGKAATIRKFMLSGTIVLLVLSIVVYAAYRNKRNSNYKLKVKQQEIDGKNHSLEVLLTEKEWLLKEIHHRVKNNLQIIISLLNSQSAYLTDPVSLDVLRDSQHRMNSIALIHHKLYQSDNPSGVYMPSYIFELTEFLQDSFSTKDAIEIEVNVAEISLDVSYAVPLGLIINEAITNAIKYAFGKNGGKIEVRLLALPDHRFVLKITDNGKGFPAHFDPQMAGSLGMDLMQGLSDQLEGRFTITGANGVTVTVEWEQMALTNVSASL